MPDLVLTNCEDEEPPSEVKSHADEEKLNSTEVYARVRWSPAICHDLPHHHHHEQYDHQGKMVSGEVLRRRLYARSDTVLEMCGRLEGR